MTLEPNGNTIHCDTEGCDATAEMNNESTHHWYFQPHPEGGYTDYCPQHHKEIRRTPPA